MQRILLSLFLFFSPSLFADESSDSSAEKTKWNVSSDENYSQEITIDTNQTTWSNVSVSADGQTLVFDMLGDIYSMPCVRAVASPPPMATE